MKSVVIFGSLALLSFAQLALAQKIEIESDPAVDFTKFKTFTVRDGKLNSKNPSLNSELVQKRIDADIQKFLTAKGLQFMPTGRVDLIVRYSLGAVRRVERDVYPAGWRGWGTRVVRTPYTEGTLVIDLRDGTASPTPNTPRPLVWRAIAREEKSDPAKIEGKLDDMVRKSLDKYPPPAGR